MKITIDNTAIDFAACRVEYCQINNIDYKLRDSYGNTTYQVLPSVRIGKGCIISANSVVGQDIPPMSIAGGDPVQILKSSY